jgi:hypothetical protein
MKKTRMYGLYAGLIFSAALLLLSLKKTDHPDTTMIYYSFLICFPFLIFFILMAMLARRKELGNHIDFNESFKAGLGVSAIAGLVYAISDYIYFKWINHPLIEAIAEENRKHMLQEMKNHVGVKVEEAPERALDFINRAPFMLATLSLVQIILIGGFISIILALIVKRKHIEVLTETE